MIVGWYCCLIIVRADDCIDCDVLNMINDVDIHLFYVFYNYTKHRDIKPHIRE
jgi:hypothetical protein